MALSRAIAPGTLSELAKRLLLARADEGDEVNPRGRAVFWIGAGASVSAGIPSGRALAGLLAVRLARKLGHEGIVGPDHAPATQEAAFAALQAGGEIDPDLTLASAYGELFARLDAVQQRDFVRRVILTTNRRQINWAHLALGELVRRRIVHTLLTTNFDDLLLDGLVRCDQLPAIIDGVESLNRIDPRPPVPQLVYLHGSQHTYSPRNSTLAVRATQDFAQTHGGLFGLLQQCSVLTVIGYAGNPGEGVMEMLVRACGSLPELPIYWVAHGQQDSLSEQALRLLSQGSRGHLIAGQDADLFFRQLLREARIGVPSWFRDPVDHLLNLAERIRVDAGAESAALNEEVDDFRDRLRHLLPAWEQVGEANRERRELRQLLLSDQHAEIWARLGERTLDDTGLLQMRAEAACELGRRGTLDVLPHAVRDWAHVLRRLPEGSAEWALAQVRFGDALAILGERGDPRAVKDAIVAYGRALAVRTRAANPMNWASTRNNQALALLTLGEWGDADALLQALDAFGDALTVYSRDATPSEWAATKSNLGNALQILGQRAGDAVTLERAVDAYTEALQVYTRDQRPRDWAMCTCDRATALLALGQLGNRQALLEAAAALEDAVSLVSREATPIDWATIRNNQGVALLALGQLGDEPALRLGIGMLREALAVRTRATSAADWAATSHNLGGALLALGRRGDEAALREAMETLSEAMALLNGEVYPPVGQLDIEGLAQRVFNELSRVVASRPAAIPGMSAARARDTGRAPARVLVVEDDAVQQELITAMLRQGIRAVEPLVCGDGAGALARIAEFRPDLVVLDLRLPDMDGQRVLDAIRQANPRLPVLIYSGDTEALRALERERREAWPALALLPKDGDKEAFIRLVPTLFKRRNGDRAGHAAGAALRA